MTVKTLSGSTFHIGPAVTEAEADTLNEYEGLSYVEIGEVEDFGEVGDESPLVNFADVGAGRVRKLKGARDAGTVQLVVGHDPLDAGQQALLAAEQTSFEYAIKEVIADAPAADYSNTTLYYRALVTSRRFRLGTNENVVRRMFMLAVNSDIIEVPAEQAT